MHRLPGLNRAEYCGCYCENDPEIIQTSSDFKIVFQRGRDSATFWDKGTEVHSLSRDKGITGRAQNLAKGQERPGQPVKIQYGTWDITKF